MPLTKVIPVMLENGPLTGSLFGTASFALTASYAANGGGTALTTGSTYQVTSSWSNNAISSSYALTASYASNIPATSSWSTQAQTASYVANAISASYALTASYSLNGGGGGTASLLTGQTFYVTTPSTAFSLSQVVVDEDQVLVMLNGLMQSRTSSYTVSSSTLTFTSTIPSGALVDVRFLNANNMAGPAVSSSYAATASYVINGVTASYVATAQTASYVTLAQTASYVLLSQTSSYVRLAQTASYIATASYALAALSASYAPNIYVLPSNVVSASAQLSNGGGTAFTNSNNLTVGQVTASAISVTTLSVVTVTSSIDYASGSNIFGTKSTDTQLFTGSVSMSGSLSVVGNITSNNVLSLASGTVSLPSLILSTDTTSGMYRIGANNIGISISAAKVLDISSTGLSVTGALSATNGYNGTVGATTPSTVAATTLAVSSTSSFTTSAPSVPGAFGFRNRIINGDMRIDQANAGTSVSVPNSGAAAYGVDMWYAQAQNVGAFSLQQVTDCPTGFVNSLKATVTTISATPATNEFYSIEQRIEGANIYDFLSGTASAKTVTLSFWAKASISGTYGVVISNATNSRFYPVSYSISATNTWEYKTITIVLDTTGTWVTDNTKGMNISFNFGVGATYAGTSGAWTGTRAEGVSGQTQLIATLSATFQISGVQLEVGSAATPFEVRDYASELMRCQRYFWKTFPIGTAVAQNSGTTLNCISYIINVPGAVNVGQSVQYPVAMRTTPTTTFYNPSAANANWRNTTAGTDSGAVVTFNGGEKGVLLLNTQLAGELQGYLVDVHMTANARL